jgi:hypothetical protein
MRATTILISFVLSTPLIAAPAAKPKDGTIEATLQGEWVAVEWEEKGMAASIRNLKEELRIAVILDDTIRISEAGGELELFQFSVKPREGEKGFHDFDFHKKTEKKNHALIKVEAKDAFSLVVHTRFLPNRPEDRPTALTSKNNEVRDPDGLWNPLLFKFKRVQKGQKAIDVIEAYHKSADKK